MIHLASADDFEFFYKIKSDPDNLYWTGYSSLPVREQLYNFFIEHISKQNLPMNRRIFIITSNNECSNTTQVGYIYFDPLDSQTASVSIAVIKEYAGRGIGRHSLEQLCSLARSQGFVKLICEIREDNARSHKMFQAVGFQRTTNYKTIFIESAGKNIKMFYYFKEL